MFRRSRNMESDERNVEENTSQNRNSRSRQDFMEPEDESPYTRPLSIFSILLDYF